MRVREERTHAHTHTHTIVITLPRGVGNRVCLIMTSQLIGKRGVTGDMGW